MGSEIPEPYMTIILIDDKTGEPLDENDPLHLSKNEYDFIASQAEKNGLSFEEEFIREVRAGMELLLKRSSKRHRITLAETGGRQRAYSYLVDHPLPVGVFRDDELPAGLEGEIEAFSQSDEAPAFLWSFEGMLEIRVEAIE